MGTLYVVATPIGNLEDITLRALRVLREVAVIAAEDTRTTRKLLGYYEIRARFLSYNEHNQKVRTPSILKHLEEGNVALVSDAGTPVVSDPGCALIRAVADLGHHVVSIPGPSAVTASIAIAGLLGNSFTFLGFLPRRSADRHTLLKSVSPEKRTLVAFETPHRLRKALADVLQVLGDRNTTVCRELTKLHEEVFYGTVSGALKHFQDPRGEFTLIIEEAPQRKEAHIATDDMLLRAVTRLKSLGESVREASAQVASAYNVPRRRVYQLAITKRAMEDSHNPLA